MTAKTKYRLLVWSIHLLFWLLVAALLYFVFQVVLKKQELIVVAMLVNVSAFILLIYFNLLVLLPRYFDKKKYLAYGIGLAILISLVSLLRFFIGYKIVSSLGWEIQSSFTPTYLGSMLFSSTFFLLLSIPLRLIEGWIKKRELEKELKTHQLEAELRFLKAQVNPHFLFNALNNIYSLSFNESKKAPEMILKLSEMMSYMLYDCKSEQVKLKSEVEYLNNYIDLQQLKKDGEFNIEFETSGVSSDINITPMLFIPFFENVFKHGNLGDLKNGWLKSKLTVENNILDFRISNSYHPKPSTQDKGGVGLENIRDRLSLLFPERHQLNIEKKEGLFSVKLTINLLPQ